MTLQELEQLAQSLRATTIAHIALCGKDWSVSMTCAPQPLLAAPPAEAPSLTTVASPAPGLALLHHPLLAENFTAPGQPVKAGDVLALVKVGAVYLPVRSPAAGTFVSASVAQGEAVEFGQEIAKIQYDNPVLPGL